MAVVVIDKHGQRAFEMLRVHDQHPIETFGSDSSDEPFRDPVSLRHLNWRANDSDLKGAEMWCGDFGCPTGYSEG